jgi:hypothetical protein
MKTGEIKYIGQLGQFNSTTSFKDLTIILVPYLIETNLEAITFIKDYFFRVWGKGVFYKNKGKFSRFHCVKIR